MQTAFILLLGAAVASAYFLPEEPVEEDRQLGSCYGDKPFGCRSLDGFTCIAFENYCDDYSHCRQNIDEGASCISRKRGEIKNLVHAFKKLKDVQRTGNGEGLIKNMFGNAYPAFKEMEWVLTDIWSFSPEYTYLEQFYNDYIPRTLHRILLYADSEDPKMFAAYLSTQPGMLGGWSNYRQLQDFVNNKVQHIFRSLVSGGYFNVLK